ncbi:MAG: hypothetical protein JO354_07860, partial [Verrucomicrobia bacterium]|nr:hypothetical protein [Verrucomicrobiota bacterium]
MKRNIPCLTTLLCSATAGLFAICTAHAGYIVTLTQQGPNVVANGSGAIDLTGLTFDGTKSAAGEGIFPSRALIGTGAAGS